MLGEFTDMDTIRDTMSVFHGTDNAIDYLVYKEGHERAGEEVCFQIAGYITSFALPCHGLARRFVFPTTLHRPFHLHYC